MPARKKPTDDAKPAKAPRKKTVETDAVAAAPPKKAPAKATGAVAKSPRKKTTADAPAAPRKPSGKSLVIVESPAKAKTIQKYLGPGFEVRASYGHVRDLPKRRKKGEEVAGIDIPAGWKPTYVVADKDEGGDGKFKKRRSAKDILAELKKEAQRSDRVFLATDPDREGEAIAWHIEDALNLDDATTFRIAFNEITRTAVQKALATPGKVDMDRVKAQEARRILDRVVGYPLSNLISKKVARALSAGRVQSVALRLVVDREREIEAFKTEEYWKITAVVTPAGSMPNVPAKVEFTVRKKAVDPKAKEEEETPALKVPDGAFPAELAEWAGKKFEAKTEQDALAILGQLPTAAYTVIGIEQKDVQERPQPPFTTSTLQQQANIRLNFTGQRTMRAAQRLYEGVDIGSDGSVALITYMRTDSTRVSEEALRNVREMIDQKYGAPYLPAQANRYASGKSAQEAHEAVRPTDLAYTPQRVEQMLSHSVEHRHDLVKLYTLIYNRFVASQMTPAIFAVTKVDIRAAQGLFKAGGKVLKFDGYRRVLAPKGKQAEAPALPALTVNQKLDLLDLLGSQHFTQPPPRYNEASLIKALEKEGIGRPSTYASIIGKITSDKRGYIEVKERKFFATEIGKVVTDLLVAHFPTVMDLKFTSHMEDELDEIETRKTQYEQVLDGFWGPFSTALRVAEEQMPSKRGVETGEVCPKCGKPLVKNYSKKTGRDFIGCSGFKEGCKYIKPGEGEDRTGRSRK